MENIINLTNYDSHMCEKFIYPSMTKLVNEFNHLYNICHFHVSLVPAGYSCNAQEASIGPMGYAGPTPILSPGARRDYFPESMETIVCTMTLNNEADVNLLMLLTEQLNVTMGGRGNKLNPLTIITNHKIEKKVTSYYVYKKSNFNQLLDDVTKMNNKITAERLLESNICEYDYYEGYRYNKTCTYMTNFVTDDELIETHFHTIQKIVGINNYAFKLEIIGTDIEPNFDLIVNIIRTAEEYL